MRHGVKMNWITANTACNKKPSNLRTKLEGQILANLFGKGHIIASLETNNKECNNIMSSNYIYRIMRILLYKIDISLYISNIR